jgi:predicted DNA-binding transcriptional regulator AlpA
MADATSEIGQLRTSEEFAEIARVPVSTVYYWRQVGRGPKGFRVGRRVLYREKEIARWLDERRRLDESQQVAT